MILTIEETGKSYEVHDERIEEIFQDVKTKIQECIEKYQPNDKDFLSAVMSLKIVANGVVEIIEDTVNAQDVLDALNAKEIISE